MTNISGPRSKLSIITAVIVLFVLLYGGGLLLTSRLTESAEFTASKSARDAGAPSTGGEAETPPVLADSTKQLEEKLKGDPDNRQLMVELAAAYSQEAAKNRNVGLLIRAVDLYQSVIKAEPSNSTATLSLALIMMDIGGYQRAVELFDSYLKVKPNDVRVRGDYALALIQAERLDDAEKQLQLIIDSKQYLVQSYLSRALIMKLRGSSEKVFAELDAAAAHAENDGDREKIAGFRAMLKSEPDTKLANAAGATPSTATGSPAVVIGDYFKNHPIIGSKLQSVRWPTGNTAEVVVRDFPVEQMPPFARAKFVDSVSKMLGGLGEGFKVVLIDADSGKELISIP